MRHILTALALALLTLTGCNSIPDYVIPPDRMAELLADIHIGETVVESNFGSYPSDSARMLLKQSIVSAHGYTMAQLDTSFMWYGAHLDRYTQVYDKTIEILETRMQQAGQMTMTEQIMTENADSADVWPGAARYVLHSGSPTRFVTFALNPDGNWKQGDMYTLRAKFTNSPGYVTWYMTTGYSDGSIETLNTRFSGDGWHTMTFFMDSTKTATSFTGSIDFTALEKGRLFVDSIQLIRRPLVPRLYPQRYRQKSYNYFNK